MAKILIIDDDLFVCRLLDRLLQRNGHACAIAANGSEALRCMQENQFDMVLCDFRLPDINGTQLLSNIQKLSALTRVIIISGYTDDKVKQDVLSKGAYDFIEKPFVPEDLITRINSVLLRANQ